MKIAVTAKGAGLGAWLDANFDTCLQIVIVDDQDEFDAWANPCQKEDVGNNAELVTKLIEEKVDVIITDIISSQSLQQLKEAGLQVLHASQGSILELVEAARNHTLPTVG